MITVEKQYYKEGTSILRELANNVLYDENDRVYVMLSKNGRVMAYNNYGVIVNTYKLRLDGRKFSITRRFDD